MLYWNADPVAVSVGPLSIHWYGLLFASAFIAGMGIMGRMFTLEGRNKSDLDSLLGCVVIAAVPVVLLAFFFRSTFDSIEDMKFLAYGV